MSGDHPIAQMPMPSCGVMSEYKEWLKAKAQTSNSEIIWDPRFKNFLSDVFSCETRVEVWDNAPLAEVIKDFMAICLDRPRLDQGRYAVFSGGPTYGGGSRGLLWVDCTRPEPHAVFLAMVTRRRGFYCLEIYLGKQITTLALPPQLLAAMHFWLRSHDSGDIVSIDLHDAGGYVYSLDPSHCGLEQKRVDSLKKFRSGRGAA